jgi:hypothetical protein
MARWPRGSGRAGSSLFGGTARQGARRHRQSPAPLDSIRRTDLDAGDDGFAPERRPWRAHPRRARRAARGRTLRARCLSSLAPDVRDRGTRHRSRPVPVSARRPQDRPRSTAHARLRAPGLRARGARRIIPDVDRRRVERAVSTRRRHAALGCDRRRLRIVGQPARGSVPAHARSRQRNWHGVYRASHGLWKHRPAKRLGGGVHAQPIERRQAALWRVPTQRPRRRRRRGDPHSGRADDRCCAPR